MLDHEEVIELSRGTAFIRARYRLGGRASSRLDAAHGVLPVELRQAAQESSGYLERPNVNFPMKITRRQKTPVHDHMVWGMVGVLRGAESCEEFALEPATGRFRKTQRGANCAILLVVKE